MEQAADANPRSSMPGRQARIRPAQPADIPALERLIDASVRGLQAGDYTSAQIEGALAGVYGVDTQLISDSTYFVVEVVGEPSSAAEPGKSAAAATRWTIAGCGGWSKRKTLYGGDHFVGREDSLLDPQVDAAKIRAFFVHPDWARRGLGSLILEACEKAAIAAGFSRLEMGATLTGVPFYKARGYHAIEELTVSLPSGHSMPVIRMAKQI